MIMRIFLFKDLLFFLWGCGVEGFISFLLLPVIALSCGFTLFILLSCLSLWDADLLLGSFLTLDHSLYSHEFGPFSFHVSSCWSFSSGWECLDLGFSFGFLFLIYSPFLQYLSLQSFGLSFGASDWFIRAFMEKVLHTSFLGFMTLALC